MAAAGPVEPSSTTSSLPAPLTATATATGAAVAGDDVPEGEHIVLLDVDEHLEALLARPEEAMVLATGMRNGWCMSSGAAAFVTPTPSWRIISEEENTMVPPVAMQQQQIGPGGVMSDPGMMDDEDEDDSDERYAALYDSVRETCGRIREEEQREARQLEEETRLALEGYTAPKRRHIS